MTTAPLAYAQAVALQQQGEPTQAEALYRVAAAAGHPLSLVGLAALCLGQGRNTEALEFAREATDAAPDIPDARLALATALAALGRTEAAVAAYEEALGLEPPPVEAHYGLGVALRALGRLDEALACFRRALSIDPDYPEAECMLAELLAGSGKRDEAIAAYRRALEIDPDYAAARIGLAQTLRADGQLTAAEAEFRRVLAAHPGEQSASAGLAAVMLADGRADEALEALRAALTHDPQNPETHRRYGLALAELGELEPAARALEAAIALRPQPTYYRELTNLRRTRAGDPCLAALRALAARSDSLAPADRVQLEFALGRALTDAGEPEAGFRHLQAGNALHRRSVRYDEVATLRLLERIRGQFTPEFMRQGGGGRAADSPVFIVGMPRSGSTVIEQVLASHPGIRALGEITAFGDAVTALRQDLPYPELAAAIGAEGLRQLGCDYLARVGMNVGGARRVTDKMLANSLYLGLIHLALPGARIVHVRRDPVATCLSCYAELFTPDQPFSYDLGELGRFHHAHDALMCHWQALLPPSCLLTVSYEELVVDFEPTARRLLAHCDLDWDARVLRFHETRRPIRTASLAQVRRPLYRSSLERWRPSEADLRPLLEALAVRTSS